MSPTGILDAFMDGLEQQGKRFEFGERLKLVSGGGWKTKKERILPDRFRKKAEEILGIPDTCCLDMYGMTEMNTMTATCPEGHYYHMPYTWFKPLVLDQSLTPVGYGKQGRFAFLDASARSYPGLRHVRRPSAVARALPCLRSTRPGPRCD